MAARAYELTKPRTMAQELVSAFPSVFLVYFQWHHNFRNIYPIVPKVKVLAQEHLEQKTKHEQNLKTVLKEQIDAHQKQQFRDDEKKIKDVDYQEKLRAIMMNKERTMTEMSMEKAQKQRKTAAVLAAELGQQQNSY